MSKNIFFITAQTVKDRTGLHFNVDEKQIFPVIKTAQDKHIQPILGSPLFRRLQAGIANNDLTTDERTLLDDYLTDALVYYVMADLPLTLSIQYFNKGAIRRTDSDMATLSMSELADISNRYKSDAEFYGDRLINFLCNSGTTYPEYIAPGQPGDIVKEKTAYRSTIALGMCGGSGGCICGYRDGTNYTGKCDCGC